MEAHFVSYNLEVHGDLTTLSSCICPGYEAVFECVVTGSGATIWSGTALDQCSNDRVLLRHSEFNNQSGYSISQICGDSGPIIGRAVSAVNDSYTSQLIVNVSQSLINATVECALSDGESQIGTKQILLTTGTFNPQQSHKLIINTRHFYHTAPLPPPNNVTLSMVNSSHLTFTWNSVSPNCQAVHYKINATNCGQCPSSTSCSVTCPIYTDTNSVSCGISNINMLATLPETCAVIFQPVVCDNVSGNQSSFTVNGN